MKPTFLRSSLLSFLVIFSLFTSSCSAMSQYAPVAPSIPIQNMQVLALQPRTAAWIIQESLSGTTSSIVLYKDSVYLFAKPMFGGWGFVSFDPRVTDAWAKLTNLRLCGNFCNAQSFTYLTKGLESEGWKVMTPAYARYVLEPLSLVANSLISIPILVLPAGAIPNINPEVIQ